VGEISNPYYLRRFKHIIKHYRRWIDRWRHWMSK